MSTEAQDTPVFVERVRLAVRRDLGPSGPTLHNVAKSLSMSVRALQRRLAEERTAFREIVDAVRAEAARARLTRLAPLSEISRDLGYSDSGGFCRAFKRWTGCTPNEYRALHSSAGAEVAPTVAAPQNSRL